jgi:tetratricopeptide (TPR) repeat protein
MDSKIDQLLVIVGLVLGQFLGIFLHECGHLLAALGAGWKPLVFRVGTGPRATVWKAGDFHVQLGAFPFGGLVHACAGSPFRFRSKWFLFAMAGPAATLGVAWWMWRLFNNASLLEGIPDWAKVALPMVLLMQTIMFLNSLFPHNAKLDGIEYPSDGKQAWMSLTTRASEIPSKVFGHQIAKAEIYMARGETERAKEVVIQAAAGGIIADFTPLTVRIVLIHWLLKFGRRAEADGEMEKVLAQTEELMVTRGHALDALACIPLFFGHQELSQQAMAYIEQAIEEEPQGISYRGTKGSLLVEAGQDQEGLAMLEEVLAETGSEHDRAICSYYIALAKCRLGDFNEARRLLLAATQKYPKCVVRSKVTKLFWNDPVDPS